MVLNTVLGSCIDEANASCHPLHHRFAAASCISLGVRMPGRMLEIGEIQEQKHAAHMLQACGMGSSHFQLLCRHMFQDTCHFIRTEDACVGEHKTDLSKLVTREQGHASPSCSLCVLEDGTYNGI